MLDFMDTQLASDADLLKQMEAFCAQHGMGITTFGRNAIGDPNLVAGMRAGRSLTLKTAHTVLDFMRKYSTPTDAAA
jgi:hypothetical protein